MMRISYFADHPEYLPTLAKWFFREWRDLISEETLEDYTQKLRGHAQRDGVPMGFVAMDGEQLLGSASLVTYDMDGREDLSPWLACLYVAAEFRRRGIGSALVQRVVQEAHVQEFAEIYLYTTGQEREDFYVGLGWSVHERVMYLGKERVIMSIVPTQ
jgi:GNAT superfamily N-acetyltransferase